MTTVKKKTFAIDTEILILRDLDLPLKIPTPGTWSVVFSKEPLREVKNSVCLNPNKTQIYFQPYIFNSRDKMFNKKVLNNSH